MVSSEITDTVMR